MRAALVLAGGALAGIVLHTVLHVLLVRIARRTATNADDALVRYAASPSRVFLALVGIEVAQPLAGLPPRIGQFVAHALDIGTIVSIAWLLVALTRVAGDVIENRALGTDELFARRIRTQFLVFRRLGVGLIVVFAMAAVLMTFPRIRAVGASLFASAGIAGIVAGMAARPALSNLVAGLQIALTEPIRIGDSVIVEGEFGTVEEIGSAFVTVKLWDLRRMIVPLSHFIEKPFQNWSRERTNMLGTVEFKVDWSVPVDALRGELERLLHDSGLWDGAVSGVQVTDLSERTMTVRALVSAADPGKLFDLRCLLRERMIAFLLDRYPGSLPRVRLDTGVSERVRDPQ